jgi:poly(A) polymerase
MIDPTGGLSDLDSKTIRMTNPRSFLEDPLRILRAFRLCAQLEFEIELETRRTIEGCSRSLENIAAERVASELMILLETDGSWRAIEQMARLGVLQAIFAELEEMDDLPAHIRLIDHSIGSLRNLEEVLEGGGGGVFESIEPWLEEYFESERKKALLKLAVLLHDVGKPRTFTSSENGSVHFYGHDTVGEELLGEVLKGRLRMSRRDVATVRSLVRHHMRPHLLAGEPETTGRAIRRFLRDLGEEWPGVLLLAFVDALATDNGDTARLQRFVTQVAQFKLEEETTGSVERLITGDDLIEEFKMSPGPSFKEILARVAEEQAEGKIRTRGEALDFVREMLEGGEGGR